MTKVATIETLTKTVSVHSKTIHGVQVIQVYVYTAQGEIMKQFLSPAAARKYLTQLK